MKNKCDLANKKVVVVGLARSGVSSALLLKNKGADVFVSDSKDSVEARQNSRRLEAEGIKTELGGHSEDLFKGADLIVVSPGVNRGAPCLDWARSKSIPVIGEIELAYRFCPAPIVAVTGTNGKSTTTTLIGEILQLIGKTAYVCGNIGKPFCGEIGKIKKDDFVSLEVSSFQLETIVDFKPKVALILNFNQNHLDRHKGLDEYLAAKKRIFMNQGTGDFTVLNEDDKIVKSLAGETRAEARFFKSSLIVDGLKLNANQCAALAVGEIFGIEKKLILKVLKDFKGLKHRMEFVGKISGVEFINDSKATTVDSAKWALNNIYKPVILIAGGRDKGVDFRVIRDLIRRKVKALILIGEAKDKIKDAYKGVVPIIEADTLKKAVFAAKDVSNEGDCVLFSPMCTSFDMFKDYEERGEVFKEIVKELKKAASVEILENSKH